MYSPTYGELKSNLQKELDIEDETFITPNELLNYFNEAVDMVESAIHTIYEDYFLTSAPVSLIDGTAEYSLPSDIFAQKIRGMFYSDGASNIFEIRRVKQLNEINFLNLAQRPVYDYRYLIKNDSTSGLKLVFYPTPNESTTNVTIWYLRNAKRFTTEADVCDIPEFTSVIVQYARWKCLDKEGHPAVQMAASTLQQLRQEMVDTLTARVPDEDNYVVKDSSHYDDFDNVFYGGSF
jgi:hypothetical protein